MQYGSYAASFATRREVRGRQAVVSSSLFTKFAFCIFRKVHPDEEVYRLFKAQFEEIFHAFLAQHGSY